MSTTPDEHHTKGDTMTMSFTEAEELSTAT